MKPPIFNPEWPEDVKALYRHDMQEMWDRSIAPHMWNQYHNQLEMYLSIATEHERLKILDVGCAQGTLALLLAERGHDVKAVDIRPQFLEYAASRYEKGAIRFICGNIMEMDLNDRFDLIFANQIIEHLVYPCDLVKRLAGWLKPGGRLVITTPNGGYLRNSLPFFSDLGEVSQYQHRQFSADGDGHFFAYSGEELQGIYGKAGLYKIRVSFFETPFISGHMKIRYIHGFIPVAVLRFFDNFLLKIPGLRTSLAHQLVIEGTRPA